MPGYPRFRRIWIVCVIAILAGSQAQAISERPVPCATGILGYLQSWHQWLSPPRRQSRPLAGSQSLMIGVPPGVTLHDREILAYHVQDLFERPLGFSWVRMLSWPLRRRFGYLSKLEPFYNAIGSEVSITWKDIPDVRRPYRTTLAMEITSEYGVTIVMLFDESPLDEEMTYFICHDIYELN